MIFLAKYPASQSLLTSFSGTAEAIHLPPAPDPDIFGRPLWPERTNAWALGLERRGMDKQKEEARVKRKGPDLFIRDGKSFLRLPTCLVEPAHLPLATISGTVGLPIPVFMRIP